MVEAIHVPILDRSFSYIAWRCLYQRDVVVWVTSVMEFQQVLEECLGEGGPRLSLFDHYMLDY